MSGSSYTGSYQGGHSRVGSGPTPPCAKLNVSATVVSPVMTYFAGASTGTILNIKLDENKVVATNDQDDVVGSINTPQIEQIKKCLEDGYNFEAKITTIEGAYIVVTVTPK